MGGKHYKEGDVDATITGKAVMWEDAGNTLEPVSAAKPLPVDASAGSATEVEQDTHDDLNCNANMQVGDADVGGGNPVPVDATGQGDVPITLDSEVVAVDATGQGDVPVTLDGEAVVLGAGSASIGKLGANSGVDIGDVDVTSLPGAVQGPGNPTIDSFSSAAVDLAASTANQSLVAAPGASKQIWVYGLFMMADTAAGTVTLQDEDDTALSGTMAVSDEGGWVLPMSGNFAMPWIKVATNKALEADTGACTVDGIITYAIVSV